MFPARHESVVSIRATNTMAVLPSSTPSRDQSDGTVFGTLGVDVACSGITDSGEDVYKTGTSMATAIATGMAVSIIQDLKQILCI